jgi:hypothetical protein
LSRIVLFIRLRQMRLWNKLHDTQKLTTLGTIRDCFGSSGFLFRFVFLFCFSFDFLECLAWIKLVPCVQWQGCMCDIQQETLTWG